jgi:threonylcarbamoyladenosine tRNA methylthiotransferase MtaB
VARGRSTSHNLQEIQRDIQAALTGGTREIVLTGVQLGAWGRDFSPPKRLDDLISSILSVQEVQRLRLSSIEPWDFELDYLALWKDERLCRHLHIPLQSGSDPILRKMGRPICHEEFEVLIKRIRDAIPGVAVTTDVIAGFPGETEEEFNTTLDFIKQINFAGGHVFTYSPRPGTAAYNMMEKVPVLKAKARNAKLREVFKKTGRNYRDQFIGEHLPVLWESSKLNPQGTWDLSGLTDNYVRVYATAESDFWNEIIQVHLEAHHPRRQALFGTIITD